MLVPGVHRIESQLLMLKNPIPQMLPFNRFLARHNRHFMVVNRPTVQALKPKAPTFAVTFHPWAERYKEEIAHLMAAAYRGHVDSDINDQYRTIPGARHFLMNIIQFPGCGAFSQKASLVAVDSGTGRVCGACLSSTVSKASGHVTQLCTLPAVRGTRLGYELLRQSMLRLVELGCETISLTVTAANVDAVRLYESVGFHTNSNFPALVWEGF
jgi:ribosomal protein S18 acetylase RimI-like enzyme